MSDFDSSINSQLKLLHARLDRVDDDLVSHYAGISKLVMGLSTNPLTSGSVAALVPFYNASSSGQTLLTQLKSFLPGADQFAQLQHLGSSAMIASMKSRVLAAAQGAVNSAISQATALATQKAEAIIALANAQAQGLVEEATIAQRQLDQINTQLSDLSNVVDSTASRATSLAAQKETALAALADATQRGLTGTALAVYQHEVDLLTSQITDLANGVNNALGSLSAIQGYMNTIVDISNSRARVLTVQPTSVAELPPPFVSEL